MQKFLSQYQISKLKENILKNQYLKMHADIFFSFFRGDTKQHTFKNTVKTEEEHIL